MTTGDDRLRWWTKKQLQSTSQSHTYTKQKVMVTVWWSAAHLIHYSFLNTGETVTSEKYAQQIDEPHGKLQCLQPALVNRKAQFFSMTKPDSMSHNQYFKSWTNWAMRFCLIHHIHVTSHQLTTTSSSIYLDKLLQGKCFHKQQEAENAFQEFSKHGFLHYRNKHTYFSLAKMCWL